MLRSMPRRLSAILLLSGMLASCSDFRSATAGFDADGFPRLSLGEHVRIGSLEDPDYGFSRIGGVEVDDLGNIYVFESVDRHIRVYSEGGELLRVFGGPGEGPGEFASAAVRFGLAGDTIWTWFPRGGIIGEGRITLFALDGRLLTTATLQQVLMYYWDGNCTQLVPEMTSSRGYMIAGRSLGVTYAPFCPETDRALGAEVTTVQTPRVQFRLDGTVADTAGSYPIERSTGTRDMVQFGQLEYPVPLPPSDSRLYVGFADGLYQIDRPIAGSATGGQFKVVRLSLDGDTIYARDYEYEPRPYSDAVLDLIAARSAPLTGVFQMNPVDPPRVVTPQDSIGAHEAIRRAISFPPFQPPIQASHVGRDGTLWLRREDAAEATLDWLILDPAGVPKGTVQLPRSGFQIVWSRGDELLAVETDAFEVPWLVRYGITAVTN